MSPDASPNSFNTVKRISGLSGLFITKLKLFPPGQDFCVPLQSFAKSASATSDSLLPVATTTAMFLLAGTAADAAITAKHRATGSTSEFLHDFTSMVVRSRVHAGPIAVGSLVMFRRKHSLCFLCRTARILARFVTLFSTDG
jgi:hypothetical protein